MLATNLVTLTLAMVVSAPATRPRTDWVGEIVFVRKPGTSYSKRADDKSFSPVGTLPSIQYIVTDDEKDRVCLSPDLKSMWVLKEDMVRLKDAAEHFTKLIDEEPENTVWLAFRGWVYFRQKKSDNALKDYSEAIRLNPDAGGWRSNRGLIYIDLKKYDEAIADFSTAIELMPRSALSYRHRAIAQLKKKVYDKALEDYNKAVDLEPNEAFAQNGLAWLLSTCPVEKIRDGKRAVTAAMKACELTDHKNGGYLDTLAAAYAEVGDFDKAVEWQEKAVKSGGLPPEEIEGAKKRIDLYKSKKAYREE